MLHKETCNTSDPWNDGCAAVKTALYGKFMQLFENEVHCRVAIHPGVLLENQGQSLLQPLFQPRKLPAFFGYPSS